jgi:hypothetical protein
MEDKMICPSCKTETRIEETKTDYIYPKSFFGMPAFWGFMNPAVARFVTVVIAAIGVGMGALAVIKIIQGPWAMGIAPFLILALCSYTVVICIRSLDKYRIKKHYQCLSCRLEWSGFVEEEQAG